MDEVDGPPGADDEDDQRGDADADRRCARAHRQLPPPRGIPLARQQRTRGRADDQRTADEQEPEDPAVVHARGVRLVIVRDPRQKERVPGDDSRNRHGDEQRDERVEPVAVDPDPRHGAENGKRDSVARERQHGGDERDVHVQRPRDARAQRPVAAAGEPQAERDGRGGEQRELVPVRERPAQPREPAVVAVQPGNHLRGERDEQHQRDQETEPRRDPRARDRRADDDPDDGEREVHERPVRVVPRSIRLDRPHDRHGLPQREPGEQAEEAEACAGEPGRPDDGTGRRDDQPCESDPEETRIARAAGAEQSEGQESAGRRGEPTSACEGLTHRRRS